MAGKFPIINFRSRRKDAAGDQAAKAYLAFQPSTELQPQPLTVGLGHLRRYSALVRKLIFADFYLMAERHLEVSIGLTADSAAAACSVTKIHENMKMNAVDFLGEGEGNVAINLKQELMDELLGLPQLQDFYIEEDKMVNAGDDLHSLIETLKDDIKKGNRANFKVLQELVSNFEQFAGHANPANLGISENAIAEMQEQNSMLRDSLLEMFDQLESVYKIVEGLGNETISAQAGKMIENALQALDRIGIEEIEVMGQFIDGKTMISLGKVPGDQYGPELEPFQVCSVLQRGFRNKDTKELIRRATVVTVE